MSEYSSETTVLLAVTVCWIVKGASLSISKEFITYNLNSCEVQHLCESDERLSLIIHRFGDLGYSLYTDEFSFIIETIVGQMLSSKSAGAISARLYAQCGGELSVSSMMGLDQAKMRGIGLSGNKAAYIKGFALLLHDCPTFFDELRELNDQEIIKRLTALRGIGAWTAKMYLIFVLNRLDVLPFEDGAFMQAYQWLYPSMDTKPVSVIEKCKPWKPYSSLAARYLYKALDSGMTRGVGL